MALAIQDFLYGLGKLGGREWLLDEVRFCLQQSPADNGPTLPLEQVAEGYKAMDERRAHKTLLKP